MQGPLKGLRVLDIGTMVAGPAAATFLADFGAEVIKIEQPGGGDSLRGIGPFAEGEGLWWQVEGRNKKSVTLDLRRPEGQDVLRQLVVQSDAVIENFRPGTLERWGVDYANLKSVNPRIVMLSVSGFGQNGPYAERAGYDRMGLAFSGVMGITGYPDRPPVRVGNSVADYATATMGAFAVMMALYHRDVSGGQGQQIDLALYESMFRYTDSMPLAYSKLGMVRQRTANINQAAAPGDTFETRDGRFLILTISGDSLFRRLCLAMDRPDMAEEARFETHAGRWAHIDELNGVVRDWIARNTADEVSRRLTDFGVPFSLVLDVADIFADPHYAARDNIATVHHPKLGELKMQGVVPKMLGTPAGPISPAPGVGQHNDEIYLGMLGMARVDYERLQSIGVI